MGILRRFTDYVRGAPAPKADDAAPTEPPTLAEVQAVQAQTPLPASLTPPTPIPAPSTDLSPAPSLRELAAAPPQSVDAPSIDEFLASVPAPPAFSKEVPGAYAIFCDEHEQMVLYAKTWPYLGCPIDERTGSTEWLIDGGRYGPARRDHRGNWIFRRCVK